MWVYIDRTYLPFDYVPRLVKYIKSRAIVLAAGLDDKTVADEILAVIYARWIKLGFIEENTTKK